MAAIMQNGLMVQHLQLMVALRQKGIEEEENRKQRERNEREEEVRMMSTWSKEES